MSGYADHSFGYARDFRAAEPRKRPLKKIRLPLEIAVVIVLAFLLVFFFGKQVRVSDDSMGNSLKAGQEVLLNRVVYRISEPKADDVVLYTTEGTGWEHDTIKRIVAVPGDYVQISDGYLFVNDFRYEPYADVRIDMPGLAADGLEIPAGSYFVMGDDPSRSEDSRYETIGLIEKDAVLGKVWFRISPLGEIGRVE